MPVRQLPEHVVNRIAAGEVVERPASVVKELVENALDAGAQPDRCVHRRRRTAPHPVTDDGGGMTRGDLALAVERHATSKLDDEDLCASARWASAARPLPSIGAVAKLAITTRHAGEPHALVDRGRRRRQSRIVPAALARRHAGRGHRPLLRDAGAAEIP